jgi:hypothetical protein|eukprot:COSAG01_NODE_2352_length_7850_cov_62.040898_7_plen_83_part_00
MQCLCAAPQDCAALPRAVLTAHPEIAAETFDAIYQHAVPCGAVRDRCVLCGFAQLHGRATGWCCACCVVSGARALSFLIRTD